MSDRIERQAAIDALGERPMVWTDNDSYSLGQRNQYDFDKLAIETVPSVQPERKKDVIQKFHDYQIEWLTSHYDLELEPVLELWIVRFLHDTANCYMMEVEMEVEHEDR